MEIPNFEQFLNEFEVDEPVNEMAHTSGDIGPDSFSKEQEWNKNIPNIKNSPFIKLLKDRMGGSRYKLYLQGNDSYFLTNENDEYLGQIEATKNQNILSIESSHANSNKIKGFYSIIFPVFFAIGITQIYSHNNLSNKAINSYDRLTKVNNNLKLQTYNTKTQEYKDWDENSNQSVHDNINVIICVTEKEPNGINEQFIGYYKRINNKGHLKMFHDKKDPALDNYLFGDLKQLTGDII